MSESAAQRPRIGPSATRARARILELIEDGVYAPNLKLPGERELAETVGVSRVVLRQALRSLAAEGYLENSPWRGWFVNAPSVSDRVELTSFTEMALARGLTPSTKVLLKVVRPCSASEAENLAIAPAAPVLELRRLRCLSSIPACVDHSVLPVSRTGKLAEEDFEDASLYQLLEANRVTIARSNYRIQAAPADSAYALDLGIAVGAPVLIGDEIGIDAAGSPILLGRVVYRSESYTFEATLFRRNQGRLW